MPSTLLRAAELQTFRTWIRDAQEEYDAATLSELVRTSERPARTQDVRRIERAMYEGSFAPKTAVKIAEMVVNCPLAITYRQRGGDDSIEPYWRSVLRPRIAPTPKDLALVTPAIIMPEAQRPLAQMICNALKAARTRTSKSGLLKGSVARAVAVVERVLRDEAPWMAFYGGASLHETLPAATPSAFEFGCHCSDRACGNDAPFKSALSEISTDRRHWREVVAEKAAADTLG
jgi:hypothetical protein